MLFGNFDIVIDWNAKGVIRTFGIKTLMRLSVEKMYEVIRTFYGVIGLNIYVIIGIYDRVISLIIIFYNYYYYNGAIRTSNEGSKLEY